MTYSPGLTLESKHPLRTICNQILAKGSLSPAPKTSVGMYRTLCSIFRNDAGCGSKQGPFLWQTCEINIKYIAFRPRTIRQSTLPLHTSTLSAPFFVTPDYFLPCTLGRETITPARSALLLSFSYEAAPCCSFSLNLMLLLATLALLRPSFRSRVVHLLKPQRKKYQRL
jgi:hypothetical protein